jgi:hypothetical protein
MMDPTVKGGVILPPCCPTVLIGLVGVPVITMPGMPSVPMAAVPGGEAPFDKAFKAKTGMSVDESIALYKADTGKTLDRATVETLFTDPKKARELLMADKDLHSSYRSILNSGVPATRKEAKARGFTQPTMAGSKFLANMFHDPWNNEKWVSPDGHLEGVYDANGDLVITLKHKGTFNFFGPDNAAGHTDADVIPYFWHLGN